VLGMLEKVTVPVATDKTVLLIKVNVVAISYAALMPNRVIVALVKVPSVRIVTEVIAAVDFQSPTPNDSKPPLGA
jgi:hypothetical protein